MSRKLYTPQEVSDKLDEHTKQIHDLYQTTEIHDERLELIQKDVSHIRNTEMPMLTQQLTNLTGMITQNATDLRDNFKTMDTKFMWGFGLVIGSVVLPVVALLFTHMVK